ncbi:ORF6N domain-containing protein [Saccharicrinis sp. FJH54]|uniref:ORF6N domain-containing protein n=1 Tax=Saccharicrinis sp. FJH54 TaxID=3344665 RepID=UPI0035D3F306
MQLQGIQRKIYEIRGHNVMLDFDLAKLYETENRKLKQAVKRNIERFPSDFMFQLTREEWKKLITNCDNLPEGVKFSPATPFVFTEQGVAMLSSVLRSSKAIEVNIQIVRAFVYLRQYALTYKELAVRLKDLEGKFSDVAQAINYLLKKDQQETEQKERRKIGYKPE